MLSQKKRRQICEDVVTEKTDGFIKNVFEAFQEEKERITEAEFYTAIGLYRIELALDVVINRLAALPGELNQ